MNIGVVARQTGLPAKTIRYYEEIGLIRADRRPNGYRDYSAQHVQTLSFLRRARAFGFSLDDCRTLLGLYNNPERASADVKSLAARHLEELRLKAAELEHLAATLTQLVSSCSGDGQPDCPIIRELSNSHVGKQTKKSSKRSNQNGSAKDTARGKM